MAELCGQRVLVTGARGFLGSALCRALVRRQAVVFGLSRRDANTDQLGISWLRADLSVPGTSERVLLEVRPDIVFHLTSHGVGSPELANVLPTFRDDLLPTVEILEAATRAGVRRIVMASSLEEPVPGTSEITPSTPYAAAKWAAGAYARMFRQLYGTSVVLTRPYMTYGPGQAPHKLIPYTILSLLRDEVPKLASGRREVDWIYVEDVIEGLLAAAVCADTDGATIDLGSGTLVPIRDVVQLLVEMVGSQIEPEFGAIPDRQVEKVRAADLAAACRILGWKPKTSLEAGLRKTVESYREVLSREVLRSVNSR
jgi:nucleoside-diphosphate-sugar epimerase